MKFTCLVCLHCNQFFVMWACDTHRAYSEWDSPQPSSLTRRRTSPLNSGDIVLATSSFPFPSYAHLTKPLLLHSCSLHLTTPTSPLPPHHSHFTTSHLTTPTLPHSHLTTIPPHHFPTPTSPPAQLFILAVMSLDAKKQKLR